ncbi:hypothetical protein [Hominenteromicrobium sp.]|uniref:beta-sandwich lipoprotein n=1 Tax=Hominenteromicrobium sp. TaxID=3073581 RepID=UPI003AF14E67
MFKKIFAVLTALMVLFTAAGCSEADKVNQNISQQAEYFQSERRVTVWNARTDNVIMYIEGYINISNNSTDELVVTAKLGENSYKVNYVYLNDYTLYVVEDISGTHTDPYHYKLYFNTNVLPEVELKP